MCTYLDIFVINLVSEDILPDALSKFAGLDLVLGRSFSLTLKDDDLGNELRNVIQTCVLACVNSQCSHKYPVKVL